MESVFKCYTIRNIVLGFYLHFHSLKIHTTKYSKITLSEPLRYTVQITICVWDNSMYFTVVYI